MSRLAGLFLFISVVCSSSISFSQGKVTVSGYIKEDATGENLIAATVAVKGAIIATYTNDYGFYSLTLASGIYTLSYSYIGFTTFDTTVQLDRDTRINVNMKGEAKLMQEVVVEARRKDENVSSTQMGKFDLPMEKIKNLPVIFGEQDILKTIQLLPGVQGGSEGSTGFFVRGGGADQNLILLDEATVYNSSHLFGFFSVFNSDAILNATLFKEGMPAEYGGRISSVLDIQMKEGNNQAFHGTGGIGIIASRLTLEGPIIKGKSSFMISGRRTYFDVISKPFYKNTQFSGSGYHFYDLNAKVNFRFSDKDRLFMSGYFGQDVFSYHDDYIDFHTPWGNATTTIRWNHLFSNKLFLNTSAIYNAYNFEVNGSQDFFSFRLFSGIHDYNLKVDLNFFPSPNHKVDFGGAYTYHIFQPQSFTGTSDTVVFSSPIVKNYAHEAAVYAQDQWDIAQRWQASGGLRFSIFDQVGPYTFVNTDPFTGLPTDSVKYKSGEHVVTYTGLEPRIQVRFMIDDVSSLKAAFTINNQYVHLVSNNGSTLPTDIWVPSSLIVKPQRGNQYSIGYFRNFHANMFETSVEVYYKQLDNQIEYKEGYTPQANENLEQSFVFGKGESYGAEFYVSKKTGRWNGWISYTLAFTNRTFPDLNGGKTFPYRYDRRHNLSIVASYQITERWTLGTEFIYQTGIAYTIPTAKYFIEGNVVTEYGLMNGYRLAPYNRLDISATLAGKKNKKFSNGWSFAVYNVYNRANPFFIYNQVDGNFLEDPTVTVTAKQVSLFPIIPSVTWNFSF